MKIEPFGNIEYKTKDKEWHGIVDNIAPSSEVELIISVESCSQDISYYIESVKQFAIDYDSIMAELYKLAYHKYEDSQWKKTLAEITEMYFLTSISLNSDNKTWLVVLEPNFNLTSIYDQFLRFTIVERKVIWANFKIPNF
jgi:hypothetical protein